MARGNMVATLLTIRRGKGRKGAIFNKYAPTDKGAADMIDDPFVDCLQHGVRVGG